MLMKKSFFFDRDGVININKRYIHKNSDFIIFPGVEKAIKYLNDKNFIVIIITNQSGIGRGIYSENKFFEIQNILNRKLAKHNAKINDVFFCPHHPKYGLGKFKKNCLFRKPNNMMMEKAINKWGIDRKKSFMIGDQMSDLMCAKKSNIKFFFKEKINLYYQIKKILKNI